MSVYIRLTCERFRYEHAPGGLGLKLEETGAAAQARPGVSCPHTTGCAKAGQPLHYKRSTSGRIRFNQFHRPDRPSSSSIPDKNSTKWFSGIRPSRRGRKRPTPDRIRAYGSLGMSRVPKLCPRSSPITGPIVCLLLPKL